MDNKVALLQWMKDENIILEQINGQRIYRGCISVDSVEKDPSLGAEIFISNIPQVIYENTLIPLFENIGRLIEFRLMMTFSGLNRGFAYARYETKQEAGLAILQLHGYEIQGGHKIVVCRSTEKCELMLDGLPCFLNQSSLTSALREVTVGVDTISLFASPTADMKNLAIVKYTSHKAASMAKKSLFAGSRLLYGCPFSVDWLKPQMKQKVQTGSLPQPHVYHPVMWSSGKKQNNEIAGSYVQTLNNTCEKMKLGQPSIQIYFMGQSSCGWLRFRYMATLPNHSIPFTGYDWLIGKNLTPMEQLTQAKELVARNILQKLCKCEIGICSYW
ncbi:dead end protein homolog 1-like [Pyxicephalus adspersus]|uniref:dead end protein homolog 1-like n=1 Tax=Pyxicephalus adspersus TaxID=30357 RepID=UPI003B5B1C6A